MSEKSCVAKPLTASQEGLSSMELVSEQENLVPIWKGIQLIVKISIFWGITP
jgi:hypothetical protein